MRQAKPEEGVLVIGAEDVLAMAQPFQHVLPFAADGLAPLLLAKQNRDAIGGQQIQAQFAGPLEDRTDGPVALEDEIAAIFQLLARMDAVQAAARRAFPLRELRADDQRPVINARLQGFPVELVGGPLQGLGIPDGNEAVVVLGERDLLSA